MNTELLNPEITGQLFDSAIAAVAVSFIVLAAAAAILTVAFIAWQCFRLTREPARPRCLERDVPRLQLIHRSRRFGLHHMEVPLTAGTVTDTDAKHCVC